MTPIKTANIFYHLDPKNNFHYFDKIGFYKNLNHLDEKRRENYYKRFGKEVKPDTAKWF